MFLNLLDSQEELRGHLDPFFIAGCSFWPQVENIG